MDTRHDLIFRFFGIVTEMPLLIWRSNMKMLCAVWMFVLSISPVYAEKAVSVDSIVGRPIRIEDDWTGQSVTIVKHDSDYEVIRTFFGSGVAVTGEIVYKAVKKSERSTEFSEIIKDPKGLAKGRSREVFDILLTEAGVRVFLNGLLLVTTLTDTPRTH
jgi:hypothetical protein